MLTAKDWLKQVKFDQHKPHSAKEIALLIEQYLLEVFIPILRSDSLHTEDNKENK